MHTSMHIFSCLLLRTPDHKPLHPLSDGTFLQVGICWPVSNKILRSELISVGELVLDTHPKIVPSLPSPLFSSLTAFALLLISDIWLNIHLLICSLAFLPEYWVDVAETRLSRVLCPSPEQSLALPVTQ